jgi:biopolymer transport protein ExbB
MRIIILSIVFSTFFTSIALAGSDELNQLLMQLESDLQKEKVLNEEREARFLRDQNERKEILAQSKKELDEVQQRSDILQALFLKNERQIIAKTQQLRESMGDLGEIFGTIRQSAGDAKGQFQNSLISVYYPERVKFMQLLSESESIPALQDLEKLWFELQREMTASSEIVISQMPVSMIDGNTADLRVMRIGPFSVVADNEFLKFLPSSMSFAQLPAQPSHGVSRTVSDFSKKQSGYGLAVIDPSRGAILDMLLKKPNLHERIAQGGIIGVVIIVLGGVGLILFIHRFVSLILIERKTQQQLKTEAGNANNPLGRLLQIYQNNTTVDTETLELKLDEEIIRSTGSMQRGIGTVKLLAAVAPLLGLLGTVVGMINTFQAITLYGTGDPKLMAGGISEALVTTMLGLIVAIPLVLLHNIVHSKSKSLIKLLEEQSTGYIAELATNKCTA